MSWHASCRLACPQTWNILGQSSFIFYGSKKFGQSHVLVFGTFWNYNQTICLALCHVILASFRSMIGQIVFQSVRPSCSWKEKFHALDCLACSKAFLLAGRSSHILGQIFICSNFVLSFFGHVLFLNKFWMTFFLGYERADFPHLWTDFRWCLTSNLEGSHMYIGYKQSSSSKKGLEMIKTSLLTMIAAVWQCQFRLPFFWQGRIYSSSGKSTFNLLFWTILDEFYFLADLKDFWEIYVQIWILFPR